MYYLVRFHKVNGAKMNDFRTKSFVEVLERTHGRDEATVSRVYETGDRKEEWVMTRGGWLNPLTPRELRILEAWEKRQ